MDRYLTWTGEKAHRLFRPLDKEQVGLAKMSWRTNCQRGLCGQWVYLQKPAAKDAPRCKTCERLAARGKAVSKP